MKIVITGSIGNISQPLAKQLIAAGHAVTVISSNPAKVGAIEALGASAAIGSLEDTAFLTATFTGADAVYTMTPPSFTTTDFIAYAVNIANSYAQAITAAGVKRVVNLSSIGAHLESGNGPIAGIHQTEKILNAIPGIGLTHVRAPFFYYNFLNNVEMVRHMGIIGNNYPANTRIVLVHPTEIAATVATALQQPLEGVAIKYIFSDDRYAADIASTIGHAIGKADLPWVAFDDESTKKELLNAGMSADMAGRFVEIGQALRNGILWSDFDQHLPTAGKIKLEDFAQEFAAVYNG
ncbi:NmrA family NAD(P)-binding protein [Chitinophaga sp. sic0106]|uniref:NAD(P)H-binding protein n=1 Tax=Chitinophaga sp. sic0106 TaxID=2854785 RepID=UPI001C448F67|nr:NmrA family NAD(P)-binding protein [Chitinophaga sp. sic0106]MBV7530344.1 NAD(P)H-binding protein [Chitinophaga sp. sic0106]